MPQSQTAANPRHQEGEKKDKNIHTQNKQTNVQEAQRPVPYSPSKVIRMLKQTEKLGHRAWEDFSTLSAPWYKPQLKLHRIKNNTGTTALERSVVKLPVGGVVRNIFKCQQTSPLVPM